MTDFEPHTSDDPDALPEPPLARASDWVEVELDLQGAPWEGYGNGKQVYLRETNTMPQWAGSCWYYLRYLDPTNEEVEQEVSRYAERTGRAPAAVRARLEKEGGLSRVSAGLRREKSIDFLIANATISGEA